MFANKILKDCRDYTFSVKGTCLEICPSEEIDLRVREKLVHVLEVTNEGLKLVKGYSRSAADVNMALPHVLRPYPVLVETIKYLMFDVSNRSDVKTWVLYDFINDRLRAVRQDITIQRLPPDQCVILLEPMIRFYVYYGYRLCECHPNEYDSFLNKKYLLECIKWFLSCCSSLDRIKEYSQLNNIVNSINNLDLSKPKMPMDRVLIESLYIMCNLNDMHPLYRYLNLPKSLRSASALKLAYEIGLANQKGNYVRLMKLSRRLCPLTFAALCLYLPVIQKRALHMMSHAYSSKQLTVPATVVKSWLLFGTVEEVATVCSHYGLTIANGVNFNKATFRDVEMPPIRRNSSAKVFRLTLEDVLCYTL